MVTSVLHSTSERNVSKMAPQYYISGGGLESGLLVYRPNLRRQHGHGLGSFFGRVFQRILPIAQKYVFPHAKTALKNVTRDVLDGKNIRESLQDNAKSALKGVANQVLTQSGSGRRGRKKKRKSAPRGGGSRKKKLRKTDYLKLFD